MPPCRPPERSADQGRLREGEHSTSGFHIDTLAASHGQDPPPSAIVDQSRVADSHSQTDQVPRSPLTVQISPARTDESPGRSVYCSSSGGSNGCVCQPSCEKKDVSRTNEVPAIDLKRDLGASPAWRQKRKYTGATVPPGQIVSVTAEIALSPEKPESFGDRGLSIRSPSRLYMHGWAPWTLTDHLPLTYLPTKGILGFRRGRRQVRWSKFLARFSLEWIQAPGQKNVADPLSTTPSLALH